MHIQLVDILQYTNLLVSQRCSLRAFQHKYYALDDRNAFSGKNTLVILLQLYRLYVVHAENKIATENKRKLEAQKGRRKRKDLNEMNHFNDIYIISSGSKLDKKRKGKKKYLMFRHVCMFVWF